MAAASSSDAPLERVFKFKDGTDIHKLSAVCVDGEWRFVAHHVFAHALRQPTFEGSHRTNKLPEKVMALGCEPQLVNFMLPGDKNVLQQYVLSPLTVLKAFATGAKREGPTAEQRINPINEILPFVDPVADELPFAREWAAVWTKARSKDYYTDAIADAVCAKGVGADTQHDRLTARLTGGETSKIKLRDATWSQLQAPGKTQNESVTCHMCQHVATFVCTQTIK